MLEFGTALTLAGRRASLLAAAALVAVLTACGGSESRTPSESATFVAPGTQREADDLAEEVTQHYFDALDGLETILVQNLPSDDLREEVSQLKDEYIALFVPYGYLREAMTDAERDTFDSRVNHLILVSTPPAMDELNSSVASLNASGEIGLANEIASFNILTQYVFFELLKEQDPEEALRLGIR